MKIGPKIRDLRSALEHSPGLLLISEKASIQGFREEWDLVIRKRILLYPAMRVESLAPTEELSRLEMDLPAREIVHFRNVTLWPGVGLVSTRKGTLITDSAFSADRLQMLRRLKPFNRYPITKCDDLPCTLIEAGSKPGDIYNFLIETLPRVWSLHRPEVTVLGPMILYVANSFPAAKEELLRALLPPTVELKRISDRSRVEAYQFVFLPYLAIERFGYLPPEYLEFFRSRVFAHFGISKDAPKKRKLLISRRRATKRRIVNEESLSNELGRQGFETVCLEELSLGQQAALFNEAEVVVGLHGAQLAHLVYSSNCKVVEAFAGPPEWHYRGLATSAGLDYASIPGDSHDKNANAVIRPEAVLDRLERLAKVPPGERIRVTPVVPGA
jgi:hypothetical protein